MIQPDRTFGNARFHDDQLVVVLPHLGLVRGRLADLGIPVTDEHVDHDDDLGLALLQLPADVLNAWAARLPAQEAQREEPDELPLDVLFRHLYRNFKEQYGGWAPTFGKNRWVDQVGGGSHNIGGGNEGMPVAVHEPLPARDAHPGAGVVVGVADSVLHRNPWLDSACHAPPSGLWTASDRVPDHLTGHAGFVTGMVLQEAPGARVEVRRVLGEDGFADSWSVAKELVQFGRLGIDVLNLSLGCFTRDNDQPLVLATALDRLDPDILVVAAAGNHAGMVDRYRPMWPAARSRVLAVGATNRAGEVPSWSPEPQQWPWVDVLAVGQDVVSAYIDGEVEFPGDGRKGPGSPSYESYRGFATWSGTSFAAAKVSGAIAARTVPGRIDATTALRLLLEGSRNHCDVPWVR